MSNSYGSIANDNRKNNIADTVIISNDTDIKKRKNMIPQRKNNVLFGGLAAGMILLVAYDMLTNNDSSDLNSNSISQRNDSAALPAGTVAVPPITDKESHPFSSLAPFDTNSTALFSYKRPYGSQPGPVYGPSLSKGARTSGVALPTNAWYQNLLLGTAGHDSLLPTDSNQLYTLPNIVDLVGPIPGIRTHRPFHAGGDHVVQMAFLPLQGLTIGRRSFGSKEEWGYTLLESGESGDDIAFSNLGLNIQWAQPTADSSKTSSSDESGTQDLMTAPIVRGMPYTTVLYHGDAVTPVVVSEIPTGSSPLVDGQFKLNCGNSNTITVNSDVELYFKDSDLSWLVFFSRPVEVKCITDGDVAFELEVVSVEDTGNGPLVVRTAILNTCTTGRNPEFCTHGKPSKDAEAYGALLRKHVGTYPYNPKVRHIFPTEDDQTPDDMTMLFDWGVRSSTNNVEPPEEVLTYALQHHADTMKAEGDIDVMQSQTLGCIFSFHGKMCPVTGNVWIMKEKLPDLNFIAPRPPKSGMVQAIADSLVSDIDYSLPDYFMKGAGDTYFSAKMLAKLGRIVVITDELKRVQSAVSVDELSEYYDRSNENLPDTMAACKDATLPTDETLESAIDRLRRGTEIWLNGTAEAQFVYDESYGGVVSCGCLFNGEGCDNRVPYCVAFDDPGANFGNGFYNDHHFHYGYMIYSAAIVSYFDPAWGREHFEEVLLLIRDIANPSSKDPYFPTFRQKDWFIGQSFASGIATIGEQPYRNGRNQESSSEAIAGYEAIGLFGSVMFDAWGKNKSSDQADNRNAMVASHVRDVGRLLTGTEIRAADTYYHVRHNGSTPPIYPKTYSPWVIGMLWGMMAQFQTWFGLKPFLAYGIQLLPLTAVSEQRDDIGWTKEMYNDFADSCETDSTCTEEGWNVLQYAVLAEVGHPEAAKDMALKISPEVFDSAGGNGHSLTNTLWYISTRPETNPLVLKTRRPTSAPIDLPGDEAKQLDCGVPSTCTSDVLSQMAGEFTCRDRITWLMTSMLHTENFACHQIAVEEYADVCGACKPVKECAPCGIDISHGNLNLCPEAAPYLCYEGTNKGGCGPTSWDVSTGQCDECCKLGVSIEPDGQCAPCPKELCNSSSNLCPASAPYVCAEGKSRGGCAHTPWDLSTDQCEECCKLAYNCED